MWGGAKFAVKAHAELFKEFRGSESVRKALKTEPRPWYLFNGIHNARHKIDDQNGAKMLTWATSVFQLEQRPAAKKEAYQMSQEVFRLLHASHDVKNGTIEAFFRLCYVGKDLSSAYEWFNLLSKNPTTSEDDVIRRMSWLLKIAAVVPEDNEAEAMACAVKDLYVAKHCSVELNRETGEAEYHHLLQPKQLEELFSCFRDLVGRISDDCSEDPTLPAWISSLSTSSSIWRPIPEKDKFNAAPVFPQLELLVPRERCVDLTKPCIIDSMLADDFVRELEAAAFSHNIPDTTRLIQHYQACVAKEKAANSLIMSRQSVWGTERNVTAKFFREPILASESGAITPELYHYLIVALSRSSTRLALDTMKKLESSNLRILDLTRAVMIWRLTDSPDEQLALVSKQLEEMRYWARLDADFNITKVVESYWGFDYNLFLYHRNALKPSSFILLIMNKLGATKVLELLCQTKAYGEHTTVQDLVSLSAAVRIAAAKHWWARNGPDDVSAAIDEICTTSPHLDVALVASMKPFFADYTLRADDEIATDPGMLRRGPLSRVESVFVLDASFIESWEEFHNVAYSCGKPDTRSLLVVTYSTLLELYRGYKESTCDIPESYDATFLENRAHHARLFERRLSQVASLLRSGSLRILHFTETLLSHGMNGFPLSVKTTNEELLAVSVLLAGTMRSDTTYPNCQARRVFLCTEDPKLQQLVRSTAPWTDDVSLVSSPDDQSSARTETNNMTPSPLDGLGIAEDFKVVKSSRRKHIPPEQAATKVQQVMEEPQVQQSEEESPWLRMLEDNNETSRMVTPADSSLVSSAASEATPDDTLSNPPTTTVADFVSPYLPQSATLMKELGELTNERRRGFFESFGNREPDVMPKLRNPVDLLDMRSEARRLRNTPLNQEAAANSGLSRRRRVSYARHLSNLAGARVPFNFRYNIYEANALDPRNKGLVETFHRGVAANFSRLQARQQ